VVTASVLKIESKLSVVLLVPDPLGAGAAGEHEGAHGGAKFETPLLMIALRTIGYEPKVAGAARFTNGGFAAALSRVTVPSPAVLAPPPVVPAPGKNSGFAPLAANADELLPRVELTVQGEARMRCPGFVPTVLRPPRNW